MDCAASTERQGYVSSTIRTSLTMATHYFVPGTVGMGVISYAGGLCVAVAADRVPTSDGVAQRICEGFEKRFDEYLTVAREVIAAEQKSIKGGKHH